MSDFQTSQPTLAKFRVDYLRLAWLSILFLIVPVVLVMSGAVSFDHDLILIFPFVVVPVGISIYRAILFLINMDLEILVTNDGFTYTNRGGTKKYSWKEIDKVWTTRFELISLIYVKYIKVKILDTSGKILILDRTLQKVDQFEAILQEQIARDKFPQAITILEQGLNLEFGGITIAKDSINNSHDTIFWSELGDIQTWQGTIRLWKKGERAISIMASIPSIPNFTLLISLIRHFSKIAQTTPLPLQEIKLEKLKTSEPSEPIKSKTGGHMRPGGNTDARLSGSFILVLGAVLGYWQIIMPIMKALRHEHFIDYFSAGVVLAPIAIIMGLFLLVFGAEGLGLLSKPPSKPVALILMIGVVILAFACLFGMKSIMRSLGYY